MKTVLIAEDEKLIRQGLRTMIERSGVLVENIIECNNGEKAYELVQETRVDVLFTDIRMPKMTGIELVQKIQGLKEKPRIVAISGYADFSYAVEMLRQGVKEYILKPVERSKIQEIMQRFEEEIETELIDSRTGKQIGFQQLKYVMLNDNITEEEMKTLRDQYEEALLGEEYYLCCTQMKEGQEEKDGKSFIYLHNVAGNDIYLTSKQSLPTLLKEELQGSAAGISGLCRGIDQLRKAYEEGVLARRAAFCRGEAASYGEDKAVQQALVEEAQKLIGEEEKERRVQLIGTGKQEEMKTAFHKFFKMVEMERISAKEFTVCMQDFFAEIRKTYRNAVCEEEAQLEELSDCFSYPSLAIYREAFMDWVLALQEKLCSMEDEGKNKYKIRQAVAYIRENYASDLNMAVVSNEISMNYSMFSYLFKQYTGMNFVNFLREIRMEKAKNLLADTNEKIIDISRQVGYDNEKHFMKSFKIFCGVSPSEYRKNHRF